jgi:hypothetical protein
MGVLISSPSVVSGFVIYFCCIFASVVVIGFAEEIKRINKKSKVRRS